MDQLDPVKDILKRTYMRVVADALIKKKNPIRPRTICRGKTYKAPIETQIGRNELCPCGSGRKFKRCCKEASND